jgi:hypothetical protein
MPKNFKKRKWPSLDTDILNIILTPGRRDVRDHLTAPHQARQQARRGHQLRRRRELL